MSDEPTASSPQPDFAPAISTGAGRRTLVWLIVGVVGAGLALWGVAAGLPLREWARDGLDALRAAGPWWFFGAMAVLPAIGFPLLPFALAAGPAFAPTLGAAAVAGCAVAAVAVDTLLGYWLSKRALRPLVQRILARFGYRVPVLPPGTAWHAVLLVRLAPGLPFWVQSYALGLMRVPLLPYVVVSTAVPALYLVGAIYGGDALWHGHVKAGLIAFGAVGLVAAAIQLWRKCRASSSRAPSNDEPK